MFLKRLYQVAGALGYLFGVRREPVRLDWVATVPRTRAALTRWLRAEIAEGHAGLDLKVSKTIEEGLCAANKDDRRQVCTQD